MNLIKYTAPAVLTVLASLPAHAGSFDGTAPLTCGVQTVVECDRDNECYPVTLEMVNLPDFFHVDLPPSRSVRPGSGVQATRPR